MCAWVLRRAGHVHVARVEDTGETHRELVAEVRVLKQGTASLGPRFPWEAVKCLWLLSLQMGEIFSASFSKTEPKSGNKILFPFEGKKGRIE